MSSRFALTLAAVALCGATSSFAQGSGLDPDRVYVAPGAQPPLAPAPAQPATPRADRRDQGPRDGTRAPRQPAPQGQPQAQPRDDNQRGDRRHSDRRPDDRRQDNHRGNDRRSYGYVVPRPNFHYIPPPVYFGGPSVYYGGVPQAYYPYNGYNAPITFQPGDYLPPEFRQQQYVVLDWQWRGLAAPPYGYYWILLGPDHYALVFASTGQIVSLFAAR